MQLGDGGHPLPGPPPPAVGDAPVKLEALNELIHFDHIYTKPLEEEEEEEGQEEEEEDHMESDMKVEAQSQLDDAATDADDEVEVETVYVKAEPDEVVIPPGPGADHFLSASPALGGLDSEAYLADYSDSGYERSPSPLSDMSPSPLSDMSSPPLCSQSSWDDVFANELFPQLFSV